MHPALASLVSLLFGLSTSLPAGLSPDLSTGLPANTNHPLVIGHRGASGLLPEHTLAAYQLAIEQGADYIEPDLVMTRDGVLISRHENEISGTTNVAEIFPERKRTQIIDGQEIEGWFSEDFTLAEIRQLYAKQRLNFRNQSHNQQYRVATFEEIIQLVQESSQEQGREIGLYIETKHPTHFRKIGLPIEPKLLKALKKHDLDRSEAAVFIQSFEVSNLQFLRRNTEVKLVQLIEDVGQPADQIGTKMTYASMLTPAGLQQVASYADGIGPYKRLIIPQEQGKLGPATMLIPNAHAAGLLVHPWTFRSDAEYLAPEYAGDPAQEYLQFFNLGVDGVFSDFAGDAFAARERWFRQEIPVR